MKAPRLYPWWWYHTPEPIRSYVYDSFRWSPVGWWWADRRNRKWDAWYRLDR